MVICYQCSKFFGSAKERDDHDCPTVAAFKERPAPAPGLAVIYNCPGFYGNVPTDLAHNTGQI